MCRTVGVETGDRVRVEMRRVGKALPQELEDLLNNNQYARRNWDALPLGARRDFILFIAAAKKTATRVRRAERLLTADS